MIDAPDRPYGVLQRAPRERRRFTPHDVHFMQAVANVLADAVERKRGEEQLERAFRRLRRMSMRVATAEQEERRRIARELHDDAGQALTCLKFDWARSPRASRSRADSRSRPSSSRSCARPALIDRTIQSATPHDFAAPRHPRRSRPGRRRDRSAGTDFRPAPTPCARSASVGRSKEARSIRRCRPASIAWCRSCSPTSCATRRHPQSTCTVRGRRRAALRVADNGIGISDDRAKPQSHGLRGIAERVALFGGTVTIEGRRSRHHMTVHVPVLSA